MSLLLQHLNNRTKKDLIILAKYHGLKGYSSLKKADLAEKLSDIIKSSATMQTLLPYLSPEETSCITAHNSSTQDSFSLKRLMDMGYCFADTQGSFVIPDDISGNLLKDSLFIQNQKSNSFWLDLMTMSGALYGCLPLSIVCDLYQYYTKTKITQTKAEESILSIPKQLSPIVLIDDLCIQKELLNNDLYKMIQLCQESIPYYKPSIEQLHHFVRKGYLKDEYTQNLMDHFTEHMHIAVPKAREIIIDLQAQFRQGGNLAEAGNYLREHQIISDLEVDKTLLSMLNSMFSHSRLLLNRGYSESEKTAMFKPKNINKATKVYPNNPCPCGSGKKYKKCCGRK